MVDGYLDYLYSMLKSVEEKKKVKPEQKLIQMFSLRDKYLKTSGWLDLSLFILKRNQAVIGHANLPIIEWILKYIY